MIGCHFCNSSSEMRISKVVIAFSMHGEAYSFCANCLKKMTADVFWKTLFEMEGYEYPPILINNSKETYKPTWEKWRKKHADKFLGVSAIKTISKINKKDRERVRMTNALRYKDIK